MPKPRFSLRPTLRIILAGLVLSAHTPAQAQTLTQDRPLLFGEIATTANNAMRDIQLKPDGSYIASPGIYFYGSIPQLGRYKIENQTPSHVMDVVIDASATQLGSNPVFTFHDTFTVPTVVVTDSLGNATFEIGGTLRTNGNGIPYPDGNYNALFSVTVTPQ